MPEPKRVELEVSEYSFYCPKCKETKYVSVYEINFEDGVAELKCDECGETFIGKFID